MSEWRPIGTAPKDGSFVLLCMPGERQPVMGYWEAWGWHYWTGENVSLEGFGDGWGVVDRRFPEPAGPTHWMPLPPLPGAAKDDTRTLNIGGGH